MNKYLTLLRRELWEYKSSLIVLPIVVTCLIVVLLSIAYIRFTPESDQQGSFSSSSTTNTSSTQQNSTVSTSTVNPNSITIISSTPSSVTTTTSTTTPTSTATATSTTTFNNSSTHAQTAANQNTSSNQSLNDQFNAFSVSTSNQLFPAHTLNPFKSRSSFLGFSIFILTAGISFIVFAAALNYAHRALFDDRKSREILFWRSMPVSETQNIAAKLCVVYGYAPVVILILSFLAGLACWLVASIAGALEHEATLWHLWSPFINYGKIMLIMFALSPIICWTLFSSAFAKKSPFMVSTLLPIGLMLADRSIAWATGLNIHIRDTLHAYGSFLLKFIRDTPEITSSTTIGPMLLVITSSGVILACTIWLRNHRYEN